ncbi:hypothetical protein SKAU_G00117850 [Synaphobranchus kaupii]|uniref:Uncharacterized protein n=1 Tax=Synaphobranchus kaupii TaxID=118154 RepID=A0A9Q1FN99_SYNKA|nr:hypothetical protein SKAU_G00117850 [Synaphobranchus kaupii]
MWFQEGIAVRSAPQDFRTTTRACLLEAEELEARGAGTPEGPGHHNDRVSLPAEQMSHGHRDSVHTDGETDHSPWGQDNAERY